MNLVYRLVEPSINQVRGPFNLTMSKSGPDRWQTTIDVESIPGVRDYPGWDLFYSFDAIDHQGLHHYSTEWSDVELGECALPTPTPTSRPTPMPTVVVR